MAQALVNRQHLHADIGPALTTTAGDIERESRSRRFNGMEAFIVYIIILTVLWPFSYVFGFMPDNDTVIGIGNTLLILGGVYLLFVAPFIHRDTLESWGLGGPLHTLGVLRRASPRNRNIMIGVMAALWLTLNVVNFYQWQAVTRLFGLSKVSVGGYMLREYNAHFPHVLLVFVVGAVLSTAIVFCGIRYDNFVSAFKTAMKISLPLLGMIFLGALVLSINSGVNLFSDFDAAEYVLGVLGYVFWGAIQQLLFCSYFGTRLRKAFGPATGADNFIAREQRIPFALMSGTAIAFAGALIFFGILRYLYPADQIPLRVLFLMGLFFFPFGAAWGYYFGLDKKRMLVATLTGSFFGLIHIDSYGLVGVTFLLGVFLSYVFMEEKNRNLVALGFIHGLLGSTFGWLFDKDGAGGLRVDYSVGPAGVDDPLTYGVVVFPVICIAIYAGFLFWSARHLSSAKPGHAQV